MEQKQCIASHSGRRFPNGDKTTHMRYTRRCYAPGGRSSMGTGTTHLSNLWIILTGARLHLVTCFKDPVLLLSVLHEWMQMRALGPGEKLILFCPICAFADVCRGSRGADSCEPKEHHVHTHREAVYHGQSLQDYWRRLSVRPVFGRDRDPCYWRGENSQTCHDKSTLLNE